MQKYFIVTGCVLVLALGSYYLFLGGKSKQKAQPDGQVQPKTDLVRAQAQLVKAKAAHSKTERTKEIGIRKAIGARSKDVMLQFLIKFVLMSVVGGCLGILTGVLASYLISTYGNLSPIISLNSVVVSFLFASFVGVFFGMYPAWKAASSNIIDALRYE